MLAELSRLEALLAEADARLKTLAELVPEPPSEPVSDRRQDQSVESELLRGPAIREIAVRVLLEHPEALEALHYRDWYALVLQAGYAIVGKDPLAVFLTQLSRSPVVRKSTSAGIYELDREAPARLRHRIEQLQAELREVAATPETPADLAQIRRRRNDLTAEIGQQERALEEAIRVLRLEEKTDPSAAIG